MDSRFDRFAINGNGLFDHEVPPRVKRLTFNKLGPGAILPMKAHATDTGFDLFLSEHTEFFPGKNTLAHTGVGVDLDEGFTALILGRSSTLNKHGLIVYPGLIDQDYQGELLISVFSPDKYVKVEKGTRLAQLVLMRNEGFERVPVWRTEPEPASSERGSGGFGSSG